MKILRIILLILLIVCAVASLRRAPVENTPELEPGTRTEQPMGVAATPSESFSAPEPVSTNVARPVEVQVPVQPIEERGDAMLYEIDALQGTPFDQSITMPHDEP